jgi:acyl carrier protein
MTQKDFFRAIENEIGEMPEGSISGTMAYKDIPNWSSMHFLIIIALCDTEYNVKINGDDFRKCANMNELYELVKSRM